MYAYTIFGACSSGVMYAYIALLVAGCSIEPNYLDPEGPRYAGDYIVDTPVAASRFKIVSYNLQLGREVDTAIAILSTGPLASADVIVMQEMRPDGVDRIAAALNLAYVYYPASVKKGGDWGNAVLSRWPLTGDHKVLLPYADPYTNTRRIAVAAHIDVGSGLLVYSVHTATFSLGLGARLDQAETILLDAATQSGPIIIGGDLNTADPGSQDQTTELFADYSFHWISDDATDTASALGIIDLTLDYVFGRGVEPVASATFTGDAGSDHRPIWVEIEPL